MNIVCQLIEKMSGVQQLLSKYLLVTQYVEGQGLRVGQMWVQGCDPVFVTQPLKENSDVEEVTGKPRTEGSSARESEPWVWEERKCSKRLN